MYNDLTKELLKFLSLIYEEIPHEISHVDLRANFRKKQYEKLLAFSKRHKYIQIISENISLTKIGKEKLFELRGYFSEKRTK